MKFTYPPESRPLEGFTIKRAIYRGGFGEVYYALTDAGREVAIKLLQNNSDVELRGVQQCLNLGHPNLVTIFDVRKDGDGDHWIVMEYIGGETLDAAIARYPDGMPMQEVRRWVPGIAQGVGFLHDRGIVHRDLKPGNIFIENSVVKVGDVGLSKFMSPSRRSAHTQSVGTVYYMAPEVARGKYGKEVDVYALGIILYEMLSGRVPFEGESTGEILMKHLTVQPDLSVLPPRVRPVIGRALDKDPARRFGSLIAMAEAFDRAVLGREPVLEIPESAFLPRHVASQPTARLVRQPYAAKTRHETENRWRGGWIVALVAVMACAYLGIASPVEMALAGGLGYAGYCVVQSMFGKRGASSVPAIAPTAPANSPSPQHAMARNGQAARGQAAGSPPFACGPPKALTPRALRPIATGVRVSQYAGSATLAAFLTALFTTGIAVVVPDFFRNIAGSSAQDPAAIGLFATTALSGVWLILGVNKLTEGRDVGNGTRRLMQLVAGGAVGSLAWLADNYLMVSLDRMPRDTLLETVGSQPLLDGSNPTWLGYVVFFGLLFGLRRWWWHTDTFRTKQFSVLSTLLTVGVAWVLSRIWAFPADWAVLWAAVISSVAQVSSAWTPPASRQVERTVPGQIHV